MNTMQEMLILTFVSVLCKICVKFVHIFHNFCNFAVNNTSHASHQHSAPGLVFDFFRGTLNFRSHEV